jgi:hypothetical protein
VCERALGINLAEYALGKGSVTSPRLRGEVASEASG